VRELYPTVPLIESKGLLNMPAGNTVIASAGAPPQKIWIKMLFS
jgi:hypothetical protein